MHGRALEISCPVLNGDTNDTAEAFNFVPKELFFGLPGKAVQRIRDRESA